MELKPQNYRAIWLSDLHLGTRGTQTELLLDFLRHTESETLYLVGDTLDIWRMKKRLDWPQKHNDVVQKLLRKARKGTRLVIIPGNHDEALNWIQKVFDLHPRPRHLVYYEHQRDKFEQAKEGAE